MADRTPEIRVVDFDLIDPHPENPNVEDVQTFNELVETMKDYGWLQPALIVSNGDRYRTVAGEHRVKAGKLAGIKHGHCVIADHLTPDEQRILLVRMNVLRGRIDPARFTALWQELSKTYDRDELMRKMGFAGKEADLRRLIKDTGQTMPERMREELQRRAERIRSVEDLAAVVNDLYARYGGTLDRNFVLFSMGGQTHLMVRCTPQTFAPMKELAARAEERGEKLDEVLAALAASSIAIEEGEPV
jgi:ParB-like chromosome segregation protein Spo0J